MLNEKAIRRNLKTPAGQLKLLALTFTGALVLAVGTLCFRSVLFEPYIRQRVAELNDDLKERGQDVADGEEPGEWLRELTPTQVAGLYGGLINGTVNDDETQLAQALFNYHPLDLMHWLEITAAVGNHKQRLNAVDLLRISGKEYPSRATELCRHHLKQARRTGDAKLQKQAEAVLHHLNQYRVDNFAGDPDE